MKGIAKNKKIIFCLALLGVLFSNSTVLAFLVWPDSPAGTSLTEDSKLPNLIQYLYEWGIALGGLAAFIALLIAGIQYLTSFGDPASMKDAMGRIKSAFFGLILLLSSWLILNTINPDLTTFRPLVIELPGDKLGACKGDEDCLKLGEKYKCVDGFCALDLESQFKITPCDSATVDGVTINKTDSYKTVTISPGDPFSVSSSPEKCMGYLELYPRLGAWGGCGGDKQQILLTGTATTEKAGDAAIKCVELKEVETSF